MRIKLDLQKTNELNDLYHTIEEKDRKELHLTDGLYCPLKAWCRIKGLEAKWTRKTSVRFNIGSDLHGEFELPFEHHEEVFRFGPSIGHPDVTQDFAGRHPLEFKHTTLTIKSEEDIPEKWIQQLELECIYVGSFWGWLAILEVVSGQGTVWKIVFSPAEIEEASEDHLAGMDTLATSIRCDNYHILSPEKKECPGCQYNHLEGCPLAPVRSIASKIYGDKNEGKRRP